MVPRLHAVTDDRVLAMPELATRAAALIERFGAAIAVHVRGRTTTASRLFEVADALARMRPAAVFMNDRVDLALAAGTAGVQLRHDSLPIEVARTMTGRRWLGYSAHSLQEARAAAAAGADFIIAGSIYESAAHPGQGQGTAFLVEVAQEVALPVIAIGGIDPDRARACRQAGAHGVAVIRAVWDAADPIEAAHRLLAALNQVEN